MAVLLPVPLLLIGVYLRFQKMRWRYKYGALARKQGRPCQSECDKARRSEKWPQGSLVRDLIDFCVVMWRNPEMPFVEMFHVLFNGRPRSESLYYGWGGAFSANEETRELAVDIYRRGLELHPDSVLLGERLVALLKEAGDWRGVARYAGVLSWFAVGSRRYHAFANLGYAQYRLGNYKAAADAYTVALELKPDSAETASALRYCRGQLTETDPVDFA